jgi:DNA polymerase
MSTARSSYDSDQGHSRSVIARDELLTQWKEFVRRWNHCTACPTLSHRQQVVHGRGELPCDILLLGEAPGRNEDRLGRPFVGACGRLLDSLLLDLTSQSHPAALAHASFFITNTVACRPSESRFSPNRPPNLYETDNCYKRTREAIALASPKVIVSLGGVAREWMDIMYPDFLTLNRVNVWHPSYVLRHGGKASGTYHRWLDSWLSQLKEIYTK